MKQASTVSTAQIKQFSQVVPTPNNRPIQAINARAILK